MLELKKCGECGGKVDDFQIDGILIKAAKQCKRCKSLYRYNGFVDVWIKVAPKENFYSGGRI